MNVPCLYVCIFVYVCLYVCIYVYLCMYVCIMYVRMYVCMYVCMYVDLDRGVREAEADGPNASAITSAGASGINLLANDRDDDGPGGLPQVGR